MKKTELKKKGIGLKLSIILALFAILTNTFSTFVGVVNGATTPIDSAYIHCDDSYAPFLMNYEYDTGKAGSHAYFVTYTKNGVEYPAYCVNKDLTGADPDSSYTVDVNSLYNNNKVWRVLKHGYPYTSIANMGLNNKYEAFYVTKCAIYTMLGQSDFNKYSAIEGKEYVYNAYKKLYNIGMYGTETYKPASVSITKSGNGTTATISGKKYYVQKYNVDSQLEFTTFSVSTSNFPNGTLILNSSNESQKSYSGTTTFKVAIPIDKISSKISGAIQINDVNVKTYPVLYGQTRVSNTQNYAMAYDPFETAVTRTTLSVNVPKVSIIKEDRDTNTKLQGAEYDIVNLETNKVVRHVGPTNSSGKVTVEGLSEGKYKVVETIAPKGYNLDSVEPTFEVKVNGSDITVNTNDTISAKIVKTERKTEYTEPNVTDEIIDSDQKVYLKGAMYDIYKDVNTNSILDEEDTKVYTTEPTNEQGITNVCGLPVGQYITKEIQAPEGYNLDDENHIFVISQKNSAVTIESDDTVITSPVEINKLAKNDNEITEDKTGDGLQGALFNIYDINHKLLYENLETDENGKLNVVLRYGDYIVEEVRPPEYYLLADDGTNSQVISVHAQGELINLDFEDESVAVGLVIEKEGIIQCQPNDEIRYNFPQLKNDSNVALDDFTWSDILPTDYIRISKLYTGTYSQDLNYTIWYKTNLSKDYIQYKNPDTEDGTYNTMSNHYIDFAKLNSDKEYITEYQIRFGTVEAGFTAVDTPFIFTKVNDTVKNDDRWTNNTYLTGNYTSIDGHKLPLASKDDWTTTSYSFALSISKLPKTGM